MPTVLEGQRTTANVSSALYHHDISRQVLELEPDSQPLTVLLNNIYAAGRRVRTTTHKFRWFEDELEDRTDAVNDATPPNAAATVVTVDTPGVFYPEALVKVVRTGEVFRVTSISGNDLTIVRGYGDIAAADFADNDVLLVIGNAREEGDVSKVARTHDPVEKYNYTQIFKDWVEESGTALSSDTLPSPHDWARASQHKMIEHQKSKELTFWFGSRGEETAASGKKVRTTGGVLQFATENNVDAGGTLTEIEFESFLRPWMRHSRDSVIFMSDLVASVLNGFSQTKIQTSVGDKVYGVAVKRWISVHGEVKFVTHPLFTESGYSGLAVGLDFAKGKMGYRYLDGKEAPGGSRDTRVREHVEENDRDGRKDEILSEVGLQVGLPKAYGVITGITG